MKLQKSLIESCKQKLFSEKKKCLSVINSNVEHANSSDQLDMARRFQESMDSDLYRRRSKEKLDEINLALEKIALGTFGLCEISGEFIEEKRLRAVPWARVSLLALHENAS